MYDLDFDTYYYYVRIDIARNSTSTLELFLGVSLDYVP